MNGLDSWRAVLVSVLHLHSPRSPSVDTNDTDGIHRNYVSGSRAVESSATSFDAGAARCTAVCIAPNCEYACQSDAILFEHVENANAQCGGDETQSGSRAKATAWLMMIC